MSDSPLTSSFVIADDFLDGAVAAALRADVDAHFANPSDHRPDTHQVWNYWYVPGSYTYLRTQPEKVLAPDHVAAFVEALRRWSTDRLGLTGVTWPYLSLYVDGCAQGLHNDSLNGRFGYVFSLTLNQRKTIGGETMILHEGDLFRSNLGTANAGTGMYDLIEPAFNRLVVFDDRVPHGVQRLDGSMDPREGRFVLHGHISEAGAYATGPVAASEVDSAIRDVVADVLAADPRLAETVHGLIVLRLEIAASGALASSNLLVNRLARSDAGDCGGVTEAVLERVRGLRFAAADGPTQVTVPLAFGSDLRLGDAGVAPPTATTAGPALRTSVHGGEDETVLRAEAARSTRQVLKSCKGLAKLPAKGLEVYALPRFLDDETCAQLIALIDQGRFPSGLMAESPDKEFRTSDSCNLNPANPVVQEVERQFTGLTGIDPRFGETIQGQRYDVGQQFKPHHDYFHTDQPYWVGQRMIGGQRTWTAMIFLNRPGGGGDTRFPSVNVTVKPRPGALLLWNNLDTSGVPNPLSLHEGMPVEAGVKYIITKWYRERPWG